MAPSLCGSGSIIQATLNGRGNLYRIAHPKTTVDNLGRTRRCVVAYPPSDGKQVLST
jgi:hypothetical protein